MNINKRILSIVIIMGMMLSCVFATCECSNAMEKLTGVKADKKSIKTTSATIKWSKYRYAKKYKANFYKIYIKKASAKKYSKYPVATKVATAKGQCYKGITGLSKNTKYNVKVEVCYDKSKKVCSWGEANFTTKKK